jgi:hypothetical protein
MPASPANIHARLFPKPRTPVYKGEEGKRRDGEGHGKERIQGKPGGMIKAEIRR